VSFRDTVVPGIPVTARLEILNNPEKKKVVVSEEMIKSANDVSAVTIRITEFEIAVEYVLSMTIPLSSSRSKIKFGSFIPLTWSNIFMPF